MTNERAILDAAAANMRAAAALIRAQGMASMNQWKATGMHNNNLPFSMVSFREEADALIKEAKSLEDRRT